MSALKIKKKQEVLVSAELCKKHWPDEHDPRVAATATWCKVSYANKEKERQYQLFGFWVANEKDEEHIVPMGDPI